MRLEKCYFCSSTVYPGHGIQYVRNDAKQQIVTPMDGEVVAVTSYLTTPNYMDKDLIALVKLKLMNFENSSAELVVVKLLLAHCPSLVRVTVRPTNSLKDEVRRFYLDLVQFPPTSQNVHVLIEELPNDDY